MARVLPDREIEKLLEVCILRSDTECVKSNSYEIRLGTDVRFQSTQEKKQLREGQFLEIDPGDLVIVSSLEKVDFSNQAVRKLYPKGSLMAFITPTTTMMREGILHASTRVSAGFVGYLNWSLRNSSITPTILQFGERIFKLTIFWLSADESPDRLYGERPTDHYQDSEGIVPSARCIPADIPSDKIIIATKAKVDPTGQLQEAGYPFSHIGTELIALHGKFEIVSKDVASLAKKIDDETLTLKAKIDETRESLVANIVSLLDKKLIRILSGAVAAFSFGLALYKFLENKVPSVMWGIAFLCVALFLGLFVLIGRK